MGKLTKFLKLTKDNKTDAYDIEKINANLDKIDAGVEKIDEKTQELSESIDNIELTDEKIDVKSKSKKLNEVLRDIFNDVDTNKEEIKKLDKITKPNLVDNSSPKWATLNIYAGVTGESGIKKNIGDFSIREDYSTDDNFILSAKIEYQIQEPVYGRKPKISIQAKGDVTNNEHMISSSVEKTGTGEFTYTNKFKLTSNQLTNNVFNFAMKVDNVLIGTFKVKELKIEKGEVATAWCYSNNDLVTLNRNMDALREKLTSNNSLFSEYNRRFRELNGGE